ncbi:long-chain fatty acid--CoA ligase [Salinirubellus salinus]|uniref:Long-chain fatty acid--CoA ligase n=1 Tax=Salinirubellus salinus TaxID=1364945 RepID=A0A9E7R0V7_9EURY|nr:long-chain fatty acid--CoA ligase [Salinirubellus salinus]UWM53631.1 long-chain fatty acid--CoA ligase [Salinirubellus salinus]
MAVETAGTEVTEGRASEEGVRVGDPIVVPEGPLCAWYLDRTERYADLPAAKFRDDGGEWTTRSYTELLEEAAEVAGGLLELADPGDRVAISAETRYEWSVVDMATVLARLVLVPVYPSFSPEQMAFVVEDAGAKVLIRESEVPGEVTDVVDHVLDLEDLPRAEFDVESAPGLDAADEDVHTLVYTSGTTGMPKGCELTHTNFLAEMEMAIVAMPEQPPGTIGTAFLPLNHIYQRMAHYSGMNQGFCSAYMDVKNLLEDFGEIRPNVVPSVPRVYRRMYDGIREAVSEEEGAKRRIAEWAMGVAIEYGEALERGNPGSVLRAKHALADRLVLSTFRERLGVDEIAYAITGAASIDAEVLYFFWGMGVPLLEGYGATETTAGLTFNRIDNFHPGTVGEPMPGTEVKLGPENEVLGRGPQIMKGYWNNPDATADALDEDGWYHTGDVGEWQDDHLKIVDRMKRLQVLDTGKNIYPAPIEDHLRSSQYVEEAMVVAEGRKYVTALVQPNFGALLKFADAEGIDYDERAVVRDEMDNVNAVPESLVEHPSVVELLDGEVAEANTHLADYERVKKTRLVPRAFSVEEDELTPTLKKRRRDIEANWEAEIESMYVE